MKISTPALGLLSTLVVSISAVPSHQVPLGLQTIDSHSHSPPHSDHPPKSRFVPLPKLKQQDALEKQWIQKRFDRVPEILKKYKYDVLLMSQREYAEDTVFKSLVPSTTVFAARRRTIYLFHARNVTEFEVANPTVWIDNKPTVWDELNSVLEKLNPKKIAVNIDRDIAFADGLHTGEGEALLGNLTHKFRRRVSSERMIPIEIVSLRAGGESQLAAFKLMTENIWAMIAEGFSLAVIEPGVTTADDLVWWFRDRIQTMNATTWFHPIVNVYGPGKPGMPDEGTYTGPINEGDMVHVDVGITAMNINTDTQHIGYVLRSNETAPPEGLINGLKKANELQDMVRKYMKKGFKRHETGNWVLKKVWAEMNRKKMDGLIFCHPVGEQIAFLNIKSPGSNWQ
ncbi:hypothetical protein FRB96_009474 [Tulasnella sp. 330]|nr:hypothetical protein FRB96_009474 [Tulasnella sp. 330]